MLMTPYNITKYMVIVNFQKNILGFIMLKQDPFPKIKNTVKRAN